MISKISYGYLKEAIKAHLDLEEDELEAMHINERFHIFANEAMQQICYSKPQYKYFEFSIVASFDTLVYDNGVLRVATVEEVNWSAYGLSEPTFADATETATWYNDQNIYLLGQVINAPSDFLSFAAKQGYYWTTSIEEKLPLVKNQVVYLTESEFIAQAVANYLLPYRALWFFFTGDLDDKDLVTMPTDLALTIPIYAASVFLQQRDLNMASAKLRDFEIALSRCKSVNTLPSIIVKPSFV